MDPDSLLARILSLGASLDDAIEGGRSVDEDAVYALAGLVLELDVWLAGGGRAPERWRRSLGADPSAQLFILDAGAAGNDVTPRARKGLVRNRRGRVAASQLALPFAAG